MHPVQESKFCAFPNCNTSTKLITPAFAPVEKIQERLNASGEMESLVVCQNYSKSFIVVCNRVLVVGQNLNKGQNLLDIVPI